MPDKLEQVAPDFVTPMYTKHYELNEKQSEQLDQPSDGQWTEVHNGSKHSTSRKILGSPWNSPLPQSFKILVLMDEVEARKRQGTSSNLTESRCGRLKKGEVTLLTNITNFMGFDFYSYNLRGLNNKLGFVKIP